MREAPALAISSSSRSAPPSSSRKARPAPKKARRPTILARVFARPGMTVAGAAFAAVMTGIVANALLFQKGRHPSPLFQPAQAATRPAPQTIQARLTAPEPPAADPAPAATEQAAPSASQPAVTPTRSVAAKPVVKHPAAPKTGAAHPASARQDGIARLLGTSGAAAKPAGPAAPVVKHKATVAATVPAPHN